MDLDKKLNGCTDFSRIADHSRGGSRTFKRGDTTSAEGVSFLGGSGGMFPQEFLKI